MTFPAPSAYREAVQAPGSVFGLPALRTAEVEVGPQGLPLVWSGAFAVVFRLRTAGGARVALRCFTRPVANLAERYQAFETFLASAPGELSRHLLKARYLEKGIWIQGEWRPVVLMAWGEGATLDAWVAGNLGDPRALRGLQGQFRSLAALAEGSRFFHGDLQQQNILVGPRGPLLVDYDNLSLPRIGHLPGTTLGTPAFTHPRATPATPACFRDRFAYILIHAALETLILAPGTHAARSACEGLLFTGADLANPGRSALFQEMEAGAWPLQGLAKALKGICESSAEQVPTLESFLARVNAHSAEPAPSPGFPPYSAKDLETLARLFPAQVHADRPPASIPNPAPRADHPAPALAAPSPGGRGRRWALPLIAGLGLMGLPAMKGWTRTHPRVAPRAPDLGGIRGELQRVVEARNQVARDWTRMAAERPFLTRLPPDQGIVVLDPATGSWRRTDVSSLLKELDATARMARVRALQAEAGLVAFDATLAAYPRDPVALRAALGRISDLPQEVRRRIQQELP